MNPLRRLHDRARRRIRRAAQGDAGVTLAELAVTTTIMSVVMAIFTTAIVQLFDASNSNELVAVTQSQLNTAFLRLDRNLRYSAGLGPVHTDSAGNVFVEYVNTDNTTGTPECAQLELYKTTKVLRRQVWPQTTKPPGKWFVLANNVSVDKSSFTVIGTSTTAGFQRLRITLVVASNPGSGHTEATTDITFTALNSSRATKPAEICKEART